MAEASDDQLRISFPASPTFTRIGRVAVAGLALRLGVDISVVEKLRTAVDTAVTALHGKGRINADASWRAEELNVVLSNPETRIERASELADELGALVERVSIEPSQISLTLDTTPTAA